MTAWTTGDATLTGKGVGESDRVEYRSGTFTLYTQPFNCTASPNEAWVTQQARNLSWKLQDEGIQLTEVRAQS